MRGEERGVEVVKVDLVDDGVLVYFSDGRASLFTREFLYTRRSGDGNMLVSEAGLRFEPPPVSD